MYESHDKSNNDDELCFTPAVDLARLMRRKELSPVELMQAVLARVDRLNPQINCFVTLTADQAMAQAKEAERLIMSSDPRTLSPLVGLPVSVKDLENTAGVRTTYGSKHFADHVPTTDATIWERLKRDGAILIGKTTTPEFGMHSVTESPLTGVTNNPWDLSRTTGGSSGGAAAAVAAGMGPLATGSDGGGSIRVPSSFCGTVGLKASRGRIPVNTAESSYESVQVVGPMTRTVADTALMMNSVAGPHPFDAYSLPADGTDYVAGISNASLKGLRVAYCPDLGNGPMEPDVSAAIAQAAERFGQDLGAHVEMVQINLPDVYEYFVAWWGPTLDLMIKQNVLPFGCIEESHPLIASFAKRAEKFSAADYYHTHSVVRSQIHTAFANVFQKFDLLIWPTTAMVAFKHPLDATCPSHIAGVAISEPTLVNQRLTEAVSHAGYPAISIPAGFSSEGLPIGLQIAAGHAQDLLVLKAAAAYEAAHPWAHLRPSL
ncbi:amidase [Pseudomonas monteilii]|uniref:amidase n=1 Tax=Pseudomonas monteilii TaxID=76759 RepID=UPI00383AFD09